MIRGRSPSQVSAHGHHDRERSSMPLSMDVHHLEGAMNADDVTLAHLADLQVQDKYGIAYPRYWVTRPTTPSPASPRPFPDAANTIHREAHGLVTDGVHGSRRAPDAIVLTP